MYFFVQSAVEDEDIASQYGDRNSLFGSVHSIADITTGVTQSIADISSNGTQSLANVTTGVSTGLIQSSIEVTGEETVIMKTPIHNGHSEYRNQQTDFIIESVLSTPDINELRGKDENLKILRYTLKQVSWI